jgi:segregation and condensation protein A
MQGRINTMALLATNVPQFRLESFEGPLDLLLHLIRENRIDIHDIPIAEITKQYLDYLGEWEELDLTIAGEYLVMAATLLEIKSKMLLPQPPPAESAEEEDPRMELVQRLLEYQQFQGTVEAMREWEANRSRLFFRGALENPDDYSLPMSLGEMNGDQLLAALKRLLINSGIGEQPITAVVPRRKVSLRLKMAEVLRKVRASVTGMEFEMLFDPPLNRYDIVLTFLSLLELLRMGRIRATQKKVLGEIKLFPIEVGE